MQIVYAIEDPKNLEDLPSIFLAGPTPRSEDVPSWRPTALEILENLGFDGIVFVPENRDGKWQQTYMEQVDWEERCLTDADIIVFWIPRDLETMPGFTTNAEWGTWYRSGKCVLGYPPGAPKMKYLDYYAKKEQIPVRHDLVNTLDQAMILLGYEEV